MRNLIVPLTLALTVVACSALPVSESASTLTKVRERGVLICGVSGRLPGFSFEGADGRMVGFDADLCRAIAAAVLGDAEKVRYVHLDAVERFPALAQGKVDVLIRNTTWTITRDVSLGLTFTGISYYDGQGFMVKRSSEITDASRLAGLHACTQKGSTSELNMADYFRGRDMDYHSIIYDSFAETLTGFAKGECDVLTTDLSQLASIATRLTEPVRILPDVISKEPLGPLVRDDDVQWFRIVKWSLFAIINAEEAGITKKNATRLKVESQFPQVRRILGAEGDSGALLGLDNDWAYRIIKQVGNYGEIFEHNLGPAAAIHLPRGLNRLWSEGGLIYAPPIR